MKYTKQFKLKILKYFKSDNSSISKTAFRNNLPKQTLARWIKLFNLFGDKGLENKKKGVKEKPNNPEIEEQVIQLWNERKRSKYKMRKDLKQRGINISEWQIQKIYKKSELTY